MQDRCRTPPRREGRAEHETAMVSAGVDCCAEICPVGGTLIRVKDYASGECWRKQRRTSDAPIRLGSMVRVNQPGSPVRK